MVLLPQPRNVASALRPLASSTCIVPSIKADNHLKVSDQIQSAAPSGNQQMPVGVVRGGCLLAIDLEKEDRSRGES